MEHIEQSIKDGFNSAKDKIEFIEQLRAYIHELHPIKQPVDFVQWIPIEKVCPNDYNPNSVARIEMGLLYKSIKHDGYTQPIVTIYDKENDKYIIVDGFHRYFTCKNNKDIYEANMGRLPCVVIDKDLNERMAATVRHNRARGKHSTVGMSNIVFEMLRNGWNDADICNNLGMEAEELVKIKHITGFSKLFENREFNNEWKSQNMLKIEKEIRDKQNNKP